MIGYTGSALELYGEAMRTVAALAQARARGDEEASIGLHRMYQRSAAELGIPSDSAWSILSTAANVTIGSLVARVAELEHTCPCNVTERMIEAAVEQVASGAF